MIRYTLTCADGHDFESWFRSSQDYDRLAATGHIACAVCGGGGVTKALMAPSVPTPAQETPLEKLRKHVEANSDYVGLSFAAEARAMHQGEAPRRAIHGEARPEDARALIEDGIPVAPLPFRPRQKSN